MWRSWALGQKLLPKGPARLRALEAELPDGAAAAIDDLTVDVPFRPQQPVPAWGSEAGGVFGGFQQTLSAHILSRAL